ncbi:hypothetical protein CSKR_112072 [Clonorchis sinensis]|uniref:Uncharacterized protein n=1 Tax=Clonorchis sinensis TaxID=79923 RepID=A0A3R7DKI9_CLOSI|nr:hypothetical protein CSKR_112072 [Clonorchis sinensis]
MDRAATSYTLPLADKLKSHRCDWCRNLAKAVLVFPIRVVFSCPAHPTYLMQLPRWINSPASSIGWPASLLVLLQLSSRSSHPKLPLLIKRTTKGTQNVQRLKRAQKKPSPRAAPPVRISSGPPSAGTGPRLFALMLDRQAAHFLTNHVLVSPICSLQCLIAGGKRFRCGIPWDVLPETSLRASEISPTVMLPEFSLTDIESAVNSAPP